MNISSSSSMSEWALVFIEGLKTKYPNAGILPYEIEALKLTDFSSHIMFKSKACISNIMALVEYNRQGDLVFLKFYTMAVFNDLMAIKKLYGLIEAQQVESVK